MITRRAFATNAAVAFLLLVLQGAGATALGATIRNVPPTPHGAPPGTPLARIQAAIEQAADELHWRTSREAPGQLRATLLVRGRHEAIVTIGFDTTSYWIAYRDSTNLDYHPDDLVRRRRAGSKSHKVVVQKGPRIHPNYNVWVEQLANRIADRTRNPPEPPTSETSPLLIADELEKLDALRRRGVLTQAEFDRQKAKLLSRE